MTDKPFLFHEAFQSRTLESFGDELGRDNPFYKNCKLMEAEFSELVDVMRNPDKLPLPRINVLLHLFWRIVGNKIAPVVMGGVPTISFLCEMQQRNFVPRSIGIVMVPENWHDMLMADPHTQMGAIVFAASQAKDYWNHKFLPAPGIDIKQTRRAVLERSWSNEAELLFYFQRTVPDFKPNKYQQTVMKEYPLGVLSVSSNYIGRDYDGVFPPFPVPAS